MSSMRPRGPAAPDDGHSVSKSPTGESVKGVRAPLGSAEFATRTLAPLPRRTRAIMTIVPLLGVPVALGAVYFTYGLRDALWLFWTGVASFVGAGKLVILTGALDSSPFGVWSLALVVLYGDMGTAMILVANLHYLYGLPWVGIRLAAARTAGARFLRNNPWMQRTARFGLVLFIAGPFQGTGSVLGVIIGGLLGLSRLSIVVCIALGAGLGAGLLAAVGGYHAAAINDLAQQPVLAAVVAIGCLLLAGAIGRRLVQGKSPPRKG